MGRIQLQLGLRLSAGVLLLLLAACSGGGGGHEGSDNIAKSCSEQFNPDAAAAAPGECQPVYNAQCDSLGPRSPFNASEAAPCTQEGADGGVAIETVTLGDNTRYVLMKPASGGRKGLYVGLHWRGGNGATMANDMRMAELAKARDLTVVLPDSPNYLFDAEVAGFLHDWDYEAAPAAIAAVITDARTRAGVGSAPVVLSGVSSGTAGASRYYCESGGQLSGLLLVAVGQISGEASTACLSAAAAAKAATAVPVVMVQGSSDPAYADAVAIYGKFKQINGCASSQTVALNEQVDIEFSRACSGGDGTALVTVKDSGHNWPGMDRPIPSNPVTDNIPAGSSGSMSIFGRVSYSFDATIQGYDLVRYLD